jgi:hypothetical protein
MRQQPPYNKLLGDKPLKSGSVIHWELLSEDGNRLKVTCGACGEDWWPIQTYVVSRNRNPNWTGYCPTCLSSPAILSQRLLEKASRSSTGRKNKEHSGSEVKRRGPTPKPADKFLADARVVVLELYRKLKKVGAITLPAVTPRLQILEHDLSAEGVRKKIQRKAGKTWEEFVESVLKNCGQISK